MTKACQEGVEAMQESAWVYVEERDAVPENGSISVLQCGMSLLLTAVLLSEKEISLSGAVRQASRMKDMMLRGLGAAQAIDKARIALAATGCHLWALHRIERAQPTATRLELKGTVAPKLG
jgi:hypothetical protein